MGLSLSNLPTADVCDQHVGSSHTHLPTAGVYDQHVGWSLTHLPTTGVCNHHMGMCACGYLLLFVSIKNECLPLAKCFGKLILDKGLNWSRKHRYLSRRLRKLCCEAAIIAEGEFRLTARWLFPVGNPPSRLARG